MSFQTSAKTNCKQDTVICAKAGVVSSGNSLTYSEADMAQLTANEAAVKEMEASGADFLDQFLRAVPASSYQKA